MVMADTIHTKVLFVASSEVESSTRWTNCIPPRFGDMVTVEVDGKDTICRCGNAVVAWDGGVQVFVIAVEAAKGGR